jgi:acetyl-CoA carboxylase carboxyltransferase component
MNGAQGVQQVLEKKKEIIKGDAGRVEKQRAAGKLTARERIAKLLDQGSFVEMDTLASRNGEGAGVVTGYGTVRERPVYLFAQDFTVHGGAMGELQALKILKVLDLAQKTGAPVLALCDSAGVRLDEGAKAMDAYARIYAKLARLSGVCPVISLVLGPCVGGAALIARLADISIMAKNVGELMAFGPQVVSAALGKDYTAKALGGADVLAAQGAVSLVADNEDAALTLACDLLDLLPGCNAEDAPIVDTDDLNRLMPAADASDSDALLASLMDGGSFIELNTAYAKPIRIALGRLGGRTVGIVASNAKEDEGRLTAGACNKAARFVRFCDCFSLPVVSLINSAGLKMVKPEEQGMLITSASQLLYAYAEATSPKVSVVVGNAIGASYVAMGGKANADIAYGWPGTVISALSPEAAVSVLYTKELKESKEPAPEARAKLTEEFACNVADGVQAAVDGILDDVIEPMETRKFLIAALEMLSSKRDSNPPKKHGNLPL